jgi:hypothetical protein
MQSQQCIDADYLVNKFANDTRSLFTQIIYMMHGRMKIGCALPYSNWFLDNIYARKRVPIDFIDMNDLDEMIEEVMELSPQDDPPLDTDLYTQMYSTRCYTAEDFKSIFRLNETVSKVSFEQLSPALVFMKAISSCAIYKKESNEQKAKVTNAESERRLL